MFLAEDFEVSFLVGDELDLLADFGWLAVLLDPFGHRALGVCLVVGWQRDCLAALCWHVVILMLDDDVDGGGFGVAVLVFGEGFGAVELLHCPFLDSYDDAIDAGVGRCCLGYADFYLVWFVCHVGVFTFFVVF